MQALPHALPRYWADLCSSDFARLDPARTVAVLPVAATEQHGPHLPLNVDTVLLEGVIATALTQLPATVPVLFLPTQAVGKSNEHLGFAGTLSVDARTAIQVWMELGACVARSGVRKLLLFNAHGGQVSLMDIVARDLRVAHGLLTYSASWYSLPVGDAVQNLFSPDEHRFGIHGGDIETSMMLALRPQQVRMDQARRFASSSQLRATQYPILGNGYSAKMGWQMQDYNPAGAAGDAAAATAEKGQALLRAAGQQLALLLAELAELPLSTLVQAPDVPSRPPGEA